MNLSTVKDAFAVFRAGEAVDDPAKWKQGQVTANAVTVFLAAAVTLAKGLGYDLHIDNATLAAVGTGLFALVNWLLTVATTKHIGLLGRRAAVDVASAPVARSPGDAAASGDAHAAAAVGSQPADAREADPVRLAPDGQQDANGLLRG